MGMYTELYFAAAIKKDISKRDEEILKYLFSGEVEYMDVPRDLPNHPFFKCDHWRHVGSGCSYYFIPFSFSTMRKDSINDCYYVVSLSNFKNYDYEISKFLDWVTPLVDALDGDHLGHCRYEEYDEPTLIYYGKSL